LEERTAEFGVCARLLLWHGALLLNPMMMMMNIPSNHSHSVQLGLEWCYPDTPCSLYNRHH